MALKTWTDRHTTPTGRLHSIAPATKLHQSWPLPLPGAPLVYATLGTAMNMRTEILSAFVEALRDEQVNLVVTVGRNGDPDRFGPQPPNVRIERYIPQTLLFPRCDLVISHGGSNTMLAALSHGIPQVMVPITADQPRQRRTVRGGWCGTDGSPRRGYGGFDPRGGPRCPGGPELSSRR